MGRWPVPARALTALATGFAATLAEERPRFVNWLPVLFGLGIWAYFALGSEPTYAAAALPLLTGIVLLALQRGEGIMRIAAACLVIVGLGFATAKLRTAYVAAPVLERTLRSVEVIGLLERREPHAKRGERLTLRLISIQDVDPARLPARARIRVMSPVGDAGPGDTLRLTATLSPPAAPALPGGYDFARSAYFQGIGAVGYALKPPSRVTPVDPPPANMTLRLQSAVEGLRQEIGRRIKAALPGESGAMATALITGERGGITEETTAAYRDSGLVHIISISGLHMAIMAGAVFAGPDATDQKMGRLRWRGRRGSLLRHLRGHSGHAALGSNDGGCLYCHHARPSRDRHAQRRRGRISHAGRLPRKPSRCRISDVVRSRHRTGGGL
jgi:competence protein ComEC